MFFEKGLDPDDGIRLRFRLVLQMMYAPPRTAGIPADPQQIEGMIGTGIDLQGSFEGGPLLGHRHDASARRGPIVGLPDQNQERGIETLFGPWDVSLSRGAGLCAQATKNRTMNRKRNRVNGNAINFKGKLRFQ